MYYWRKLTDKQRQETLDHRRIQHFPKHSPPHFDFEGENRYIITAACYEHHPIIGSSTERLSETEVGVLEVCEKFSKQHLCMVYSSQPLSYFVENRSDQVIEKGTRPI